MFYVELDEGSIISHAPQHKRRTAALFRHCDRPGDLLPRRFACPGCFEALTQSRESFIDSEIQVPRHLPARDKLSESDGWLAGESATDRDGHRPVPATNGATRDSEGGCSLKQLVSFDSTRMAAAAIAAGAGSGATDAQGHIVPQVHITLADMAPSSNYAPDQPTSEQLEREQEVFAHQREINNMMKKYHHDSSGNLDAQGLKEMIIKYTDDQQLSQRPVDPKPDEIAWILSSAGQHHKNTVDKTEADFALMLWRAYLLHKERVNDLIDKRFKNRVQVPESDEIKSFLIEVGEGQGPKVFSVMTISSVLYKA